MMQSASDNRPLDLSIVVPALNEQDNVDSLLAAVATAMADAGLSAELIVVDDGSSDQTLARLHEHLIRCSWLRVLHWTRPRGQSAALGAGIGAARAPYIAMLDADLQNDPADLNELLKRVRCGDVEMAQGVRRNRKDNFVRRVSGRVGRTARLLILGDRTADTGCSTRVLCAELARQLPMQFAGMHRFLPAYARMIGATVVEVNVRHHARRAGATKYSIRNRIFKGLIDCLALRWMDRRLRQLTCESAERTTVKGGAGERANTRTARHELTPGGARS